MLPADVKHLVSQQKGSAGSSSNGSPAPNHDAIDSVLSVLSPSVDEDAATNGNGTATTKRRKKSIKGWDGETIVLAGDSLRSIDEQDGG